MGSCLNVCNEILKSEIEIHRDYVEKMYLSPEKKKESSRVKIKEKAQHEIEKTVDNSFLNSYNTFK